MKVFVVKTVNESNKAFVNLSNNIFDISSNKVSKLLFRFAYFKNGDKNF